MLHGNILTIPLKPKESMALEDSQAIFIYKTIIFMLPLQYESSNCSEMPVKGQLGRKNKYI